MFGNILPYASENFQIFMNNNLSPSTTNGYGAISYDEYIWNKPSGIKMVNIYCIGGGGAGGLGAAGANGTARGGGGGGGSGAIFTVTYPAKILPNTLLVAPSEGAVPTTIRNGGAFGTNNTGVYMDDGSTLVALAKTGGNGGDASGTTAGAQGAGGQSTQLDTDISFARFGNYRSQIGLGGGAGGAGAAANAGGGFTVLATFCLTGGGGGGSATAANSGANGGAIVAHASGLYPGVAGGIYSPSPGVVGDGNDGYTMFAPFVSVGGTGGAGGTTSTVGGIGGNGGIGSGGGGSGGGNTQFGGGNYAWGGNGGPGMVIISCW